VHRKWAPPKTWKYPSLLLTLIYTKIYLRLFVNNLYKTTTDNTAPIAEAIKTTYSKVSIIILFKN